MSYTNEENRDMLRLYFIHQRNSNRASEAYFQEFPERRQPHYSCFARLDRNLAEYGSFHKPRNKYGDRISEEDANGVLEQVYFNY